jgi:type I restriction enzyme, S subunit
LKDLSDLPSSWITVNIESVTDSNPKHSKDLEDELEISFIPMSAVDEVIGTIKDYATKPLGDIKKGYAHFANGDVIFAKITPCMENGKCAVAKNLTNGIACGSTEFQVLRPNGIVLAEYLYRYLRQESYRNYAAQNMTGVVGQRRVPRQFLLDTEIPLPPLNEQRRIVSTIEQLTDRSHKARAALEDVPKLIAQFRQSVLAAAFRGDLTADWREKNPDVEPASELLERIKIDRRKRWEEAELDKMRSQDKEPKDEKWKDRYKESKEISSDILSDIPDTWLWTSMDYISEIELGKMLDRGKEKKGKMLPYLRNQNVRWLKFDLDEVFEMDFSEHELERFSVKDGDILVCEGGEPGRAAIWSNGELEVQYQKTLHRVRLLTEDIQKLWIVYCLKFSAESGSMERYAGGSTIKHLTKISFQSYPIPLPPFKEQKEIIHQIEKAFRIVDNIEIEIIHNREAIESLDRSILAKAFRGELVPQDPNDEPAAVLLERIRAERAGTERSRSDRTSTPKQRGRTTRKNSSKQLSIVYDRPEVNDLE